MEKLFKALASETRRRILNHLIEGPMTVGEIGNHFEMALPSISKHLAILKEEQKRGQYVLYSLAEGALADALYGFLAEFDAEAARVVEARRLLKKRLRQ
jgi:DNA-binding transcriptional ArsR family regulator